MNIPLFFYAKDPERPSPERFLSVTHIVKVEKHEDSVAIWVLGQEGPIYLYGKGAQEFMDYVKRETINNHWFASETPVTGPKI